MSARPYHPRLDAGWWLRKPAYLRYMLRELSCIAIGLYVAVLVVALLRIGQGPEAWAAFRTAAASGTGLSLQLVALAFALLHSISWFALAPRTMPLQIGARHVPGGWIAGAHYRVWVLLSVAIVLAVEV